MSFAADADVPVFVPRVTRVDLLGGYRLAVGFMDGSEQDVDLQPFLHGDGYGPLRDPEFFNRVAIDPHGSLRWPNGVTISLWALHDWPREGPRLAAQVQRHARTMRRLQVFRRLFALAGLVYFLWAAISWAGWLGSEPASARDLVAATTILGMATSSLIQKRAPVPSIALNFISLALYLAFVFRH
jgi:hypothetical protein